MLDVGITAAGINSTSLPQLHQRSQLFPPRGPSQGNPCMTLSVTSSGEGRWKELSISCFDTWENNRSHGATFIQENETELECSSTGKYPEGIYIIQKSHARG